MKKKFKWVASCDDAAFEDESTKLFDTEQECYNDMRNAVLGKMKWNTEYDEDFHDLEEGTYICYEVKFNQRKITHESYSGLYTYTMIEIDDDPIKTFELTKSACTMIADALYNKIRELDTRNDDFRRAGVNGITQEYINSNELRIGELKTLLDYIKIDL